MTSNERVDWRSLCLKLRDAVQAEGQATQWGAGVGRARRELAAVWEEVEQAEKSPVETSARIAVDGDVMPWGWRPRPICRAAPFRNADPPQDCDAPFCGCVPAWDDAIAMLQECGWKSPQELRAVEPAELRCAICTKPWDEHKTIISHDFKHRPAVEPERYHGIGCATRRGGVCNCAADVAQPEKAATVRAIVVPSVCGKPMPDGKGAGQCINVPGHEGECDDMPF